MLRFLSGPGALRYTEAVRGLWLSKGTVGELPDAAGLREHFLALLGDAEPFYVVPMISRFIAGAAVSVPDYPLAEAHVPTPSGWVYFPDGIATTADESRGVDPACVGFAWASGHDARSPRGYLQLAFFTRPRSEVGWACPVVFYAMSWEFGASWIGAAHRGSQGTWLLAIVAAFFAFIEQRLLVPSPRPVTNRAKRARLRRALLHEPTVHVVELRRRLYPEHDEGPASSVEWACQWLVRGHWHRYHTREGLSPRWVDAYVKGPSDKPLRPPRRRVFEVVR
jgi:hypothetical protein